MSPALSFSLEKAVRGDERTPLVKVGGALLETVKEFPKLFSANVLAGILHASLAVATVVLGEFKQRIPLFVVRNAAVSTGKDTMTFGPVVKSADLSLPPVWLTFYFCAITAAAHGFYATGRLNYYENAENGTQWLRWIEYALSAPPMLILIAMAAGEREAFTLATYASLTALTMICGAGGEFAFAAKKEAAKAPRRLFLLAKASRRLLLLAKASRRLLLLAKASRRLFLLIGVALQTLVWALLFVNFAYTATTAARGPPAFVYGIVAGEVVLFCSFAVIHILHTELGKLNGLEAEGWYIFLSFVSKAVLAILLLWFALRVGEFDDAVQ